MRITLLGLVFLVACGSGNRSTSDASGPGDGASGDGAPGSGCGGLSGHLCGATEYCDYPDNGCGFGDQLGTCQPRPDVCPVNASATPAIVAMQTCACDGKLYGNDCDAARAGFDVDARGACNVPAGNFACGDTQCIIATQYCRRQPHSSGADTFSCAPLPGACSSSPGCACLQSQPCGNSCTGTAATGLSLNCPPTP